MSVVPVLTVPVAPAGMPAVVRVLPVGWGSVGQRAEGAGSRAGEARDGTLGEPQPGLTRRVESMELPNHVIPRDLSRELEGGELRIVPELSEGPARVAIRTASA
jgi:hypothetical protein